MGSPARFAVRTLQPFPLQEWSSEPFDDRGAALDSAAHPALRPFPGTVVRVVRLSRRPTQLWLGVANADGVVVEAPPWPERMRSQYNWNGNWVEAWFGAPAPPRGSKVGRDPQWMLAQANRLDRRLVCLAACAAVRVALPVAGNHPDLVAALDAAEAWAERRGTMAAVRRTLQACWRVHGRFASGSRATQAALAAFNAAECGDPNAGHDRAGEACHRAAHAVWSGDWRRDPVVYDPRILEAVDRFVPFGLVMLSKLYGRDPTWPREDLTSEGDPK